MEYTKQNFKSGQILTAEALNNMDSSLESAVNELNNKQEKITDGSIPLSALADDVKNKIENAGADWNAQEGEPGYIENKPFKFIDKHENAFFYDADYNPNYIIWDAPSAYDSSTIQILDFDGNPKYIDLTNHANGSFDNNMDNIFGYSLSYEWINGELGIKIPQWILDSDDDIQTYVNDLRRYSTGGELVKIDGTYIPDTVIKTTSQTLTDTDKNQALTNLGIDPVVWKYLLKPYKIAISYDYTEHMASFIDTEISDSDLVKVLIRTPEIGRLLIAVVADGSAYPVTIYHDDTPHYSFKVLDGDIRFILNEDGTISEG